MGELFGKSFLGLMLFIEGTATAFGYTAGGVMMWQILACLAILIAIPLCIWWLQEMATQLEVELMSYKHWFPKLLGYLVMPIRLVLTFFVMLIVIAGTMSMASMARDWWHAGNKR